MRGTAWRRMRAGVVVLLLSGIGLLAGCSDAPAADAKGPAPVPDEDPLRAEDGRDLRTGLTINDSLLAPPWQVGDHWDYDFYFGMDDAEGDRIRAIATQAGRAGAFLATDDVQVAKVQSFDGFPVLGPVRDDLAVTPPMGAWAGTWDWFDFPLKDGATWHGEMPNIAFDVLPEGQVPIRFSASFNGSVDVAGKALPGFDVEGRTDNGTLLVEYSYAPMVGWITRATVYDIDPGQDPIEFTMVLTDHGSGWSGTYYIDEATVVLENFDGAGLDGPPPEGDPFVSSSPEASFVVTEGATYLYGFVWNGAILGARTTVLHTPGGQTRDYHTVGAIQQEHFVRIDEPALSGEWRMATTGAGGLSASHVLLAEIHETSGTL